MLDWHTGQKTELLQGSIVIEDFLREASFRLRALSLPAASECVCVCVRMCVNYERDCPRDNSSPLPVRITKFVPEVQKTLVKIHIAFVFVMFNLKLQISLCPVCIPE